MKKTLSLLLAAISLAYPLIALANPIYWPEEPNYFQFISIPILLVLEGVILASLAEVNFIRFTGVWSLVTGTTFMLLMLAIGKVTDVANFSNMSFGEMKATEAYAGVCIVVGEIMVTLIEAVVLYFLLKSTKITGKAGYSPSIIQCLRFSAIANVFSFIGGALILKLPALLMALSETGVFK